MSDRNTCKGREVGDAQVCADARFHELGDASHLPGRQFCRSSDLAQGNRAELVKAAISIPRLRPSGSDASSPSNSSGRSDTEDHAEHSLMQSMQRMWRNRIDIMQCHSLINVEVIIPLMRAAWKKEGRIRFISATHHDPAYFGILADLVEGGSVDFVQVHYSIATREAEERVFKAAADHGVGVFVNMPLEKARLHKVVAGRALPAFATELGMQTWSQFFLKWVISHPAITCALQATSNPDHVAENVGALRGPLPDREMRARMVRHMETIPGFDKLAQMPWYPDKHYAGLINRALGTTRARA
jgi:aryl-alcohol dehydrogenase-like predicted oxidoreductase